MITENRSLTTIKTILHRPNTAHQWIAINATRAQQRWLREPGGRTDARQRKIAGSIPLANFDFRVSVAYSYYGLMFV